VQPPAPRRLYERLQSPQSRSASLTRSRLSTLRSNRVPVYFGQKRAVLKKDSKETSAGRRTQSNHQFGKGQGGVSKVVLKGRNARQKALAVEANRSWHASQEAWGEEASRGRSLKAARNATKDIFCATSNAEVTRDPKREAPSIRTGALEKVRSRDGS